LGPAERRQEFINRFAEDHIDSDLPKYHFGSHYSNPGIVLFYLMRQMPYTKGMLELQGGSFDLPDRLFGSVGDAYRWCTTDCSDVRELIPEFFYLPEMLINSQRLELGTRQDGRKVDNVELPRWAKNAHEFVRINRAALESDIASSMIHSWIDLIFGNKQRGREAEKNLNVFYHLTYEGAVDFSKIEDSDLRLSMQTQIAHFGQCPSQLLKQPHPKRSTRKELGFHFTVFSPESKMKLYRPLTQQMEIKNVDLNNQPILRAIFWQNKIYCVRNNDVHTTFKWWSSSPQSSGTGTPFSCSIEKTRRIPVSENGWITHIKDPELESDTPPIDIFKSGKGVLFGGYTSGAIKFWDGHKLTYLCQHLSTVTCVTISESENYFVSGSQDGEVILWISRSEGFAVESRVVDHNKKVTSVDISENLGCYCSSSEDGSINIYSILCSQQLIRAIRPAETRPIHRAMLCPGSPAVLLTYSKNDSTLATFSVNGEELNSVTCKGNTMKSPLITRDHNFNRYLVFGNELGEITIHMVPNLNWNISFRITEEMPIRTVVVSSDMRYIIASCSDGELTIITDPTKL